jgi:hypothetical protein
MFLPNHELATLLKTTTCKMTYSVDQLSYRSHLPIWDFQEVDPEMVVSGRLYHLETLREG